MSMLTMLPREVVNHIMEYDSTYHDKFEDVLFEWFNDDIEDMKRTLRELEDIELEWFYPIQHDTFDHCYKTNIGLITIITEDEYIQSLGAAMTNKSRSPSLWLTHFLAHQASSVQYEPFEVMQLARQVQSDLLFYKLMMSIMNDIDWFDEFAHEAAGIRFAIDSVMTTNTKIVVLK